MKNNLEMKLLHLYIKKVMPRRTTFRKEEYASSDEEWNPEKILKSLSLEDFLKCEDTRQILINEHYDNFEKNIKPRLEHLYEKYNFLYRNEKLLGKDWENISSNCFANLIYNYINVKYDLEVFYQCPALAIELLESKS
jgi:hypothetical protein